MLQRMFLVCWLAVAFLCFGGCCSTHPYMCDGMGGFDSCGLDGCDCGGGCGGSCGVGVPGPVTRHPVAGHIGRGLGCGAGCGDVYWGESCGGWADGCDPCDSCGNWTGHGACCHPFRWLFGPGPLWGYRYAPGCCNECGDSGVMMMPGVPGAGVEEVIESPGVKTPPATQPEPTPAAGKQASAKRAVKYAKYSTPTGRYVRRQITP